MVLFTILALTLAFLVVFSIIAISAGGAVFIVVFGDVIVCAVFIIWLMKHILKKK